MIVLKDLVANANENCKIEYEIPAGQRNNEDRNTVRSCILAYMKTKLSNGNNIIHVITNTPKQRSPGGYFPGQVHFYDMNYPLMVVLGIRRSPIVKDAVEVYRITLDLIQLIPNPSNFVGMARISSKDLIKPLWTYINASTTIMPSAIIIKEQVPNSDEINFTTWKDTYGVDFQMTDFKKFDWEYESSLNFNERLKIAKRLVLFKKWDENDISLTGDQSIVHRLQGV